MTGWPLPWRSDVEERRKAELVEQNTRRAVREAIDGSPIASYMDQDEDEDGFVEVPGGAIGASPWRGPQDDEWREGQPWSWLHGTGHGGDYAVEYPA